MKRLFVAAWALVALCAVSCSNGPDIDDLAEGNVQVDSTKMYRDVEIKFRGTDYDKYTVNLYAND